MTIIIVLDPIFRNIFTPKGNIFKKVYKSLEMIKRNPILDSKKSI